MPDLHNTTRGAGRQSDPLSDAELLTLFQNEPDRAWQCFIDKYADNIFSLIRSLGFDYDESMDRFVYVCEKLCEKDFRRLKGIKYAGSYGDLSPWVRQVVKRLCINWAWSEDGRKRLLKPISRLGARERRVFELYFWNGLSPAEIEERLRQEHFDGVEPATVFTALDQILSQLSEKKLWRLISNLSRARRSFSLDEVDEESDLGLDPRDERPDPEQELIRREEDQRLQHGLQALPRQDLLIVQFRFEHALSTREIAEMLKLSEHQVKRALKASLQCLKKSLKSDEIK